MSRTQDEKDDEESEGPGHDWRAPSRGPDKEGMVNSFIPEEHDWPAKTILDIRDPHRVAALDNYDKIFPSAARHQPVIDSWLDVYLRSRTSVVGKSRDQIIDVLTSMFGNKNNEARKAGQMLADAFAADLDDD